ncbi:hypothetical protein ACFQE5_23080 [Pseudonocardia hispaniensis]|uniref:Uncharacterized protein n=1 Tax=Pseudonocardia hispaniensis TaxID=904933 RepID=A0ABW1J9T0_9PSEU
MSAPTVITVATATTLIDLEVNPGDPIDLLVPILDANDAPVQIDDPAGWSARSQVRATWQAGQVLHEWTTTGAAPNAEIVAGLPGHVRLTATPEQTAAWQQTWPALDVAWDLDVTEPATGPDDPDGGPTPHRIAKGRIRLNPQITR